MVQFSCGRVSSSATCFAAAKHLIEEALRPETSQGQTLQQLCLVSIFKTCGLDVSGSWRIGCGDGYGMYVTRSISYELDALRRADIVPFIRVMCPDYRDMCDKLEILMYVDQYETVSNQVKSTVCSVTDVWDEEGCFCPDMSDRVFECEVEFDGYSITFYEDQNPLPTGLEMSFTSLEHAKSVIATLLMDIEKNPGPVVNSKPVIKKSPSNSKRDEKRDVRWKVEQSHTKKEQKKVTQMMTQARTEKMKLQAGLTSFIKSTAYAASNYVAPGVGTAAATLIEGPNVLEMLKNVGKTTEDLRSCANLTAREFPHLLQTADAIATNTNMAVTSVNYILTNLKEQQSLLSTFLGNITGNPMYVLVAVVMAFVAFSYPSIWTGVPMLFLVLHLLDFDAILIRKLRQICGYQFQSGENSFAIVGQVVFTILAFCGVGMIPGGGYYDSLLRRLDLIPKGARGAYQLWEKAGDVYSVAEREFRVYVLGQERSTLQRDSDITVEVSEWVTKCESWLEVAERKKIARSTDAVNEVTMLFRQMSKWLHTRNIRQQMPKDVLAIVLSMQPRVNDLYKLVCRSTVHEGGPRKSPLCVLFSGPSGRGKSELIIPAAYKLLASRGYKNESNFFKDNIYFRCPEVEYWDEYCGQLMCVCDDAFQVKDTVGKPSVEFMESIRLCNTAPCQVHCADLNDKGTFFSSEILLYTTNITHSFHDHIESLNCPAAAVRRLNSNAFRVKTRPEYAKRVYADYQYQTVLDTSKVGYTTEKQAKFDNCPDSTKSESDFYCVQCKMLSLNNLRQDPSEANIAFCFHHYVFVKYDMSTDMDLSGELSWAQMIDMITAKDKDNRKLEERKLAMYDVIADNPAMFQSPPTIVNSEVVNEEFTDSEVDLNNERTYELYKQLVAFRQAYSRYKNRVGEEATSDDMARHLQRIPHLWHLSELMDTSGYIPRQDQERMDQLQRWLAYFVGLDNIFATVPEDAQNLRDFYSDASDPGKAYKEFVNDMDEHGCDIKVRNEDALEDFLDNHPEAVRVVDILLRREAMCPKVPRTTFIPVDETNWQFVKRKFWTYYENITGQVQEFFRENTFLKLAGLIGLLLSMIGVVRAFLPNSEETIDYESPDEIRKSQHPRSKAKYESEQQFPMERVVSESPDEMRKQLHPRDRAKYESPDEIRKHLHPRGHAKYEGAEEQGLKDPGGFQVSTKLVMKQMYCMHTDQQILGNVLFVKGFNLLLNKHYVKLIEAGVRNGNATMDTVLSLSNANGLRLVQFPVGYLLNNHIPLKKTLSSGEEIDIDATILPLHPKVTKVPIHGNIINLFVSKKDLSQLRGAYSGLLPTYCSDLTEIALGMRPSKFTVPAPAVTYKHCARVHGEYDRELEITAKTGEAVKFREYWSYESMTQFGDCGAPLVLQEPSLARKIVGVHSAGGVGFGLSQCITQEMLNEVLKNLPVEFQACVDMGSLIKEDCTEENVGSVPLGSGLIVEGLVDPSERVISGSKCDIIPSPLHGEINGEPKTKPTLVKPKNGVNPMALGVTKFSKSVPLLDHKIIDVVVDDFRNNFEMNPARRNKCEYARVLTFEEAVQGVPDEEFIPGLNRKSSMGYGFKIKDGKRGAFGYDEWKFDTPGAIEIKEKTMELIENARQQKQTNVLWTDTLKMERRSIEKVDQGKTRVFTAGPAHFTIAGRMYFLGPCAWLMHNRNHNEISPGTNVYSQDWETIVRKLVRKVAPGSGIIAGDFPNFDGSLNGQLLWAALELFNDFCDDGEDNANIRRGLWMHIVNAVHINDRTVYRCTHSQPSGCPLTAILNSVYVSLVFRYVYLLLAKEHAPEKATMKGFHEAIDMVAYGDDHVLGVAPTVYEWFNSQSVGATFATIGHGYTDDAKTGVLEKDRCISDVGYLKRKFVWNDLAGRHVAPLDIDTVLEIPQWTKKGLLRDQIVLDNIDSCLRELALHGEQTFTRYMTIIRRKCIEHDVPYRFRTYLEYFTEVLNLPFFEGRDLDETYEVCVNDLMFSCESERAKMHVESGRIPKQLCDRMQGKEHVEGYCRFDRKNRLVHLLVEDSKAPRLIHKLRFVHHEVGVPLRISKTAFSAEIMKQLCAKCDWLKCDL